MWIELHDSLIGHRKVTRLARDLEISKAQARGHLVTLWLNVMRQAADGVIDDWEPADVADAADWEGDAKTFADALVARQLVDRDRNGARLHNWTQYAAHLKIARRRATDRERKKRERHDEVTRTSGGHPADADQVSAEFLPDRPTRPTDQTDRHDRQERTPPTTLVEPEPEQLAAKPPAVPGRIGTADELTQVVADFGWQIFLSPKQAVKAETLIAQAPITKREIEHARAVVEAKKSNGKRNAGLLLAIIEDERSELAKGPKPGTEHEKAQAHEADLRRKERRAQAGTKAEEPGFAAIPGEVKARLGDILKQIGGDDDGPA